MIKFKGDDKLWLGLRHLNTQGIRKNLSTATKITDENVVNRESLQVVTSHTLVV